MNISLKSPFPNSHHSSDIEPVPILVPQSLNPFPPFTHPYFVSAEHSSVETRVVRWIVAKLGDKSIRCRVGSSSTEKHIYKLTPTFCSKAILRPNPPASGPRARHVYPLRLTPFLLYTHGIPRRWFSFPRRVITITT